MHIQCKNSDLESHWGMEGEVICLFSEHDSEGQYSQRDDFGNKETVRSHFFSPTHQYKHIAFCGNKHSAGTHYQTFLRQAPGPTLQWTHIPSHVCHSPSALDPFLRRLPQTPAHTTYPDFGVLQSLVYSVSDDRPHFTSRPHHT